MTEAEELRKHIIKLVMVVYHLHPGYLIRVDTYKKLGFDGFYCGKVRVFSERLVPIPARDTISREKWNLFHARITNFPAILSVHTYIIHHEEMKLYDGFNDEFTAEVFKSLDTVLPN